MSQDLGVQRQSYLVTGWLIVALSMAGSACGSSDSTPGSSAAVVDAGPDGDAAVTVDAAVSDSTGGDGEIVTDADEQGDTAADVESGDAALTQPSPAPILWLDWDGQQPDAGDGLPLNVPLDNGRALAFDGDDRLELSDAEQALLALSGSFTVMAEVQAQGRPHSYDPILSKWNMTGDQRSFEFGIERTQFPYLLLSGDGAWGDEGLELTSERQVRLGRTYLLAAVFDPGQRAALYIDGNLVGETTEDVPLQVHPGDAVATLGNRSGASDGLEGLVGQVLVFDQGLSSSQVGAWAAFLGRGQALAPLPPVRAITKPPGFHWFGYYDKLELDPSGRYVLGMKVDFEGRSPEPDDIIQVGMVDLQAGDAWIPIGQSRAWSWQQGCMLQWRPGSSSEVLWNDREGDGSTAHFVTRIKDIETGILRTLPRPVHHVSPDGSFAIGSDFARWGHMRVGYGYVGVEDPYKDELAPAQSTIYHMNLDTGATADLFDLATIASIPHPTQDLSSAKHFFSVIQVADDSDRFLFFHRWLDGGMGTRVFTASKDGSGLRLLTNDWGLSHMDWRGSQDVLIYTGRGSYDLYSDIGAGPREEVLSQTNGHQTYFPGYDWLLTDTYPDARRNQHVYLYDILGDEIFVLGSFFAPPEYAGEGRCDTHPRLSPDGKKVVIDSPHDGGRQLYLIDFDGFAGP